MVWTPQETGEERHIFRPNEKFSSWMSMPWEDVHWPSSLCAASNPYTNTRILFGLIRFHSDTRFKTQTFPNVTELHCTIVLLLFYSATMMACFSQPTASVWPKHWRHCPTLLSTVRGWGRERGEAGGGITGRKGKQEAELKERDCCSRVYCEEARE